MMSNLHNSTSRFDDVIKEKKKKKKLFSKVDIVRYIEGQCRMVIVYTDVYIYKHDIYSTF